MIIEVLVFYKTDAVSAVVFDWPETADYLVCKLQAKYSWAASGADMSVTDIQDALLVVHKKYAKKKNLASNHQSDLCDLWSTTNPPDVLIESRQADDLADAFDFGFDEDQLIALYDMTIAQASVYIQHLLVHYRPTRR